MFRISGFHEFQHHGPSRIKWTAGSPRHDVDLVKEPERKDRRYGDHENQSVADPRESHALELLPARGAIDGSSLIEHLGNILKSSQQNNHLKSDPLPDADEHHCGQGPGGVVEPVWREGAEGNRLHHGTDQSVGIEEQGPDNRRRGHHGYHRKEEHSAEKDPPWDLAVHQDCQPQGEHRLQRNHNNDKPDVVEESLPERRAGQSIDVVVNADKAGWQR